MMGTKKLSELRAEVREAFAKEELDPDSWLARQLRKLQGKQPHDPRALETLQLLRQALADTTPAVPKKTRKRLGRMDTR